MRTSSRRSPPWSSPTSRLMAPAIPNERRTPERRSQTPARAPHQIRARHLQKLRSTMKTAFLPPRSTPQKREFKTRTNVRKMWAAATELTKEVRRGRQRGLWQAVVDLGGFVAWGGGSATGEPDPHYGAAHHPTRSRCLP